MSTKTKKPATKKISLPVTVEEPDTLFMGEAWAAGISEGVKFDLTRNISGGAIHFYMDKKTYSLSVRDMVSAFLTLHKEIKK